MTAQQLKNSILQMAVQGKLVPQIPSDEPASVLLERIRAEKEKLIKAGKIKKEKNPSVIFRGSDNLPYEKVGPNDPVCIADEVPFDIPDTWEWIRLGSICEIARGGSPRPINQFLTDSADGINWIKIGDSDKGGKFINSTKEKIIPEAVSRSRLVHAGDFLLTNSMSFGRPYILNIDGCIHDGWLVLSGFQHCYNKDFLFYLLSSTFAYSQFCGVVSGAVVKNLNRDKVAGALFPLPPLAEQQRLVAKIEELLPYIENYDRAEQKLDKLNTEFPEQLKKSILQWAIQGKLLPQNPNDEPASVLLERIRAEKAKLIKEGKIKKDKEESVIFRRDNSHYEKLDDVERCIDYELPFEIPENWCWVRFGTALVNRDAERIPLSVAQREKLQKKFDYYGASGVIDKVDRYLFDKPLLLIGEDGANLLLRSKPVAFIASGQYWVNNHAHVIDAVAGVDLRYIALFINATNLAPYVTGTAQPKMNQEKLNSILVPLPPTAEQRRIVSAFEEIAAIIQQF